MESRMEIPQEIKNGSNFLNGFSNPTSGNISEKMQNTNLKERKYPMFNGALFTITNIWKQPKSPSIDEWIKQLWEIYTVEYYFAIRKKKILSFATV